MHHKRRDEIEAELEQLNKDYSELEYKLGCILDRVTGGCISKPHTDVSLINEAIHRQVQKEWEYAIEDYKESQAEEEEMYLKCRTCESCEYGKAILNNRISCENSLLSFSYVALTLDKDFGCNKFKAKDAE